MPNPQQNNGNNGNGNRLGRDEMIRRGAHQLWEQAGKPQGRDNEFWHQAEQQINSETPPPDPLPAA